MKPKKITNEKPLKINKTFDQALKILADPPRNESHSLVKLIKKRRKKT